MNRIDEARTFSRTPMSHAVCCQSLVRGQVEVNWDGSRAQSCLLVISHRLLLAMAVSADGYGSDTVEINVVC